MDERADATSPETGSAQHVLPSGTVLGGRFRLLGTLAAPGPHAVVYHAEGEGGEALAVKELLPTALVGRVAGDQVVRPHDPASAGRMADARRRFVLEAQLLEEVDHVGLPRVRTHFKANGTAYIVTELIGGRTLEQLLAGGGRLATADAGRITVALLEALEVLHAQGILHRDIAPANVLLDADERPWLLGLATPRQLLMYGMPGAVAPRQGFAAIEMYGSRGKGPWTDVHGVAALLYCMLTGTAPTSAVDRAAGEGLVPPSRLVAGVPWTVDSLVMKGLAQRSEERPHSADRFRALLEEALAGARVGLPGSFTPTAAQTPPGALAVVPQAAASDAPGIVAVASRAPASAFAPPAHQASRLASPPMPAPVVPGPALGPTALSLLAPDVPQLTDDELREDELLAGTNLGIDAANGALVLPREERSMTRLLQWGAAGAAMLLVVVLVTRALVGGPDRVTLEASSAPAAAARSTPVSTPAASPAASPATSSAVGPTVGSARPATGATRVESARPAGVAAAAPAVIPTPATPTRARDGSALESRRPAWREAERREESELRIEVPRVQLPAIAAPGAGARQPVPVEVVAQLEDALSAARTRAEAGDYAGAQAALRALDARVNETAERYLSSSALDGLRRRVERERQRARDACLALNFIARRRNGRILVCE